MTKLTKEDLDVKHINQLALETAGLLGPYTRKEFDDLSTVEIVGWELIFTPSKLDPSFGTIKLRPRSALSVMWLNRGRAMAILREFPNDNELQLDHVEEFVSYIKTVSELNRPKVRSFLVEKRHELNESIVNGKVDYPVARRVCVASHIYLSAELNAAIIEHLPNILGCLNGSYKVPKHQPRKNKPQQQKATRQ